MANSNYDENGKYHPSPSDLGSTIVREVLQQPSGWDRGIGGDNPERDFGDDAWDYSNMGEKVDLPWGQADKGGK